MTKLIRFRRLHKKLRETNGVEVQRWEIAFSEARLFEKLGGDMAEIIMPAKSLPERLWRRLFPLQGIDCQVESPQ